MNKPRIYVLGQPAIEYLKTTMADGLMLSQQVLEELNLNQGRIYTMLPDGVDIDAIVNYSYGGFTYDYAHRTERIIRKVTITKQVVALVHSFLSKNNGKPVCIFEATLLERGYRGLKDIGIPYATFQDEVYLYLDQEHNSLSQIERTMRSGHGAYPPMLALMATLTEKEASVLESGQVSLDFLKRFAEKTEHIAIGAFDGEGYLIWDKVS